MSPFLIYGANGYTGSLIAHAAVTRGYRPVLAGRDGTAVAALGRDLGLAHRPFALDSPAALDQGVRGVKAVLHCAGPFAHTSRRVSGLDAALRRRWSGPPAA